MGVMLAQRTVGETLRVDDLNPLGKLYMQKSPHSCLKKGTSPFLVRALLNISHSLSLTHMLCVCVLIDVCMSLSLFLSLPSCFLID